MDRRFPPTPGEREILAARGPKTPLDPHRPYAMLVEDERAASGAVEPVATVFLTNRECPYRCLMCDLWRHTLDDVVPLGAIPAQIDYALERLPPAAHLKLYNSGNFFDPRAVPPDDHAEIVRRAARFRTLIVENHPRMCGDAVTRFRDRLDSAVEFEVALGLETVHPVVLERLNKRMTADDFALAAQRLLRTGVQVRAFVLLRPPLLDEAEGIEWAVRSVEFARDAGARCVAIIPTRGGNGVMETLAAQRLFERPTLAALEIAQARCLRPGPTRVFVDLWDAEQFADCPDCAAARIRRLDRINRSQQLEPLVECSSPRHGRTGAR